MMETLFFTKDNPRSSGTFYLSDDYNSGQTCLQTSEDMYLESLKASREFSWKFGRSTLRLDKGAYPYGLKYVEPVRYLQEPQYWQPKETPGPRIKKKSSTLLNKLMRNLK